MKPAVREAFYDFNTPFEGAVPYFYQDVLGLVSIGVGILTDPIGLALSLPMVKLDGSPATQAEIVAEWHRIKALGSGTYQTGNDAAKKGHLYAKPHTTLRLTDTGLRSTVDGKLLLNDSILQKRFPDFDTWPADAQLAIHSLAWGCGPAFRFPKLEAALKARDFATAANEVRMVANGVELHGLKPRNAANKKLLLNAALVEESGIDPDTLYWPSDPPVGDVPTGQTAEPFEVSPSFDRLQDAINASVDEYRRGRD